jgi:hypothetical protein
MAKKKTKDTKGLAGIVNKVPRTINIRWYITYACVDYT